MKTLLFMFLVSVLAVHSLKYHYDNPQVSFQHEEVADQAQTIKAIQPGTTVIKGNNGKNYEVTMSVSKKIFETRLPPKEEIFAVQQVDQRAIATADAPYLYTQPVANSLTNSLHNGNFQQSFNNQQQPLNFNSNQYNGVPAANNAQTHCNHFAVNTNNQHLQQQQLTGTFSQRAEHQPVDYIFHNVPQQQQQQEQQQQEQQQQFGTFTQNVQQQEAGILDQRSPQEQQYQQQRQQYYPQQYERYLQQPLPPGNNYLPNSNNLLNDLVNNRKYVSQSEASQLDAYAYKQINGNLRPFTRAISKCDVLGQCESQNADAGSSGGSGGSGGSDYHHQQVLKQMKAVVEPHVDKCQNKFNYQFTGHALTNNEAKAQRGIVIQMGTALKDRRLFPYSEFVISEYPHN